MVSICTVPARGGRSCKHFSGYKTINRIPLPFTFNTAILENRLQVAISRSIHISTSSSLVLIFSIGSTGMPPLLSSQGLLAMSRHCTWLFLESKFRFVKVTCLYFIFASHCLFFSGIPGNLS